MENENVTFAIPSCSSVINKSSEIQGNNKMIEDSPRICPLCKSEVRLFFINFNEKMLMCENTDCEFPFGYEELQFVKENKEVESDEEVASIMSKMTHISPTATCSTVSAAAWSEINKVNRVYDSEDSQFETKPLDMKDYLSDSNNERKIKRKKREKETQKQIRQNVEDIKELNMMLLKTEESLSTGMCIKNEKWIKNLMSLQGMSGVQLVKPEEIDLLKKTELDIGSSELKIDMGSGDNSMIKIELTTRNEND